MFTPELFWPVGSLLLLVALIYGMVQYKRRNRANDGVTEKAAQTLYDNPAEYDEATREDLKKEIRPS